MAGRACESRLDVFLSSSFFILRAAFVGGAHRSAKCANRPPPMNTQRETDEFGLDVPVDSPAVIKNKRSEDESPPSRQDILWDFEKLIEQKKLFGATRDPAIIDSAEFDSTLIRKRGKGSRFLIRKAPSRARLLRLWAILFRNVI